jgi:uncharacterized RDD family membrane protein YckC
MVEKQDVKYASFSNRVLAIALDITLVTFLFAPISPAVNNLFFGTIDLQQFVIAGSNKIDASAAFSYLSNNYVFMKYFGLQFVTGMVVIFLFMLSWMKFGNTPGKWILGCKIVDVDTLQPPTRGQYLKRALGYIISGIPLCIGFFSMPWTEKSQCWHDKIANTVVIKVKHDFTWLQRIKGYITDLMKRKLIR